MSDESIGNGHCLCGKVKITAPSMSNKVEACHCDMCRRWAERGFCKNCGSHLFYRLKDSNQYIMGIGLFETKQKLIFEGQVFIDRKPDYYSFSNNTNNMTGAEVFAKYAP